MKLHDQLLEELAEVRANSHAIIVDARVSRRHRRIVWAASGLAAGLIVVIAGWALTARVSGPRAIEPTVTDASVAVSPRSIAGGLSTAIQGGVLGDIGMPTGWLGTDSGPLDYGVTAEWDSSAGSDVSTLSLVMIRRHQDGALFGTGVTAGRFNPGTLCRGAGCQRTRLENGDVLFVVESASDQSDNTVILDSLRRDLVLYANARAGDSQVAYVAPSTDQLAALVEAPWWGWRLPANLETVGSHLESYSEDRIPPRAPSGSTAPAGRVTPSAASPGG